MKASRPWTKTALCNTVSNGSGKRALRHIRHKTGGDDLEGQTEPGQETRQVAGDARAHGQQASEEREHGEEQADDEEGEHEPRHQEIVLGAIFS